MAAPRNSILRPFRYPVLKVRARPKLGQTTPHSVEAAQERILLFSQMARQEVFRECSVNFGIRIIYAPQGNV
jgi:hypothetical protein